MLSSLFSIFKCATTISEIENIYTKLKDCEAKLSWAEGEIDRLHDNIIKLQVLSSPINLTVDGSSNDKAL